MKENTEDHLINEAAEDAAIVGFSTSAEGSELDAHAQDSEVEEVENYEGVSLSDMGDKVKDALKNDQIKQFRKNFLQIKSRVKEIFDEEKQKAFDLFVEEGGKPENFHFNAEKSLQDVRDIINKFGDKLAEIRKKEDLAMQANLLAKQDVIDELRNLISNETDIKKAFERFNELKSRWSSIGNVPLQHAEDLWKNYKHLTDSFYSFVEFQKDIYEIELKKNLEIKQGLIVRVKALEAENSINKSIEDLRTIQKEWREAGPVPRDVNEQIFEEFKAAVDKIYNRREEFVKSKEEERAANLAAKTIICEQLEAFNEAHDVTTLAEWKKLEEDVQKFEDNWKKIGRAAQAQNDQIWERFKTARRNFHKKRYAILDQQSEVFKKNYAAKVALCEKAEAIQNSTEWKKTAQELIHLQNEWKKIGPVARKSSDAIWTRFRAACDTFFNAKENHFSAQTGQEAENAATKKGLIEKILAYTPSENAEESLQQIKAFQNEWNGVGFVPMKEKKALDESFEKAINAIFEKLQIDPAKKHRVEFKVKLDTILASGNAMNALKEERTFIGNKMRKIQDEVVQIENNLGFFGHSKGADSLKKQYEDKITKLRNEISELEDKRNMIKTAIKNLEESN